MVKSEGESYCKIRSQVKKLVENNGHDFDVFLEDLRTKGQVPMKLKYPFFSHNTFGYLKGVFNFPFNCRAVQESKFDMGKKNDKVWSVRFPKVWKGLVATETIRELVHKHLMDSGYDKNLGVRR